LVLYFIPNDTQKIFHNSMWTSTKTFANWKYIRKEILFFLYFLNMKKKKENVFMYFNIRTPTEYTCRVGCNEWIVKKQQHKHLFLVVWRGVASRSICERWGWIYVYEIYVYGEFSDLQNLVVHLRILEILRWIFICKILWWIWESLKFWGEFSFAKSCGEFENPQNFGPLDF
jgi:hypothetical protein